MTARVVCAIDELRSAFAKYRKHGISQSGFIGRLTISERRTLFLHAGLTDTEFNQPHWRMDDEACTWREALLRALRELFSLFEYALIILTAVKSEQYLHLFTGKLSNGALLRRAFYYLRFI